MVTRKVTALKAMVVILISPTTTVALQLPIKLRLKRILVQSITLRMMCFIKWVLQQNQKVDSQLSVALKLQMSVQLSTFLAAMDVICTSTIIMEALQLGKVLVNSAVIRSHLKIHWGRMLIQRVVPWHQSRVAVTLYKVKQCTLMLTSLQCIQQAGIL